MSRGPSAVPQGVAESASPCPMIAAGTSVVAAHDMVQTEGNDSSRDGTEATNVTSIESSKPGQDHHALRPVRITPSQETPDDHSPPSSSIKSQSPPSHHHVILDRGSPEEEGRVTSSPPPADPADPQSAGLKGQQETHKQFVPPRSVVRAIPRATTSSATLIVPPTKHENSVATTQDRPVKSQSQSIPTDSAEDPNNPTNENNMLFQSRASVIAAQRRRNFASTNAMTEYEADLTSKDRAKQKEAVRKYLAEKVKIDWAWEWPQPTPATSTPGPKSNEHSETEVHAEAEGGEWRERVEWLSNASGDDDDFPVPGTANLRPSSANSPTTKLNPFRFESPDGVGESIKKSDEERKRRRKRRLAQEMAWNDGLSCFVRRRDAWTGARRVARTPNISQIDKSLARTSLSSNDDGSSTAIENDEDSDWEDDTEIPIAPSIIPPENAMRASILPAAYNTIYDKVVAQALTPSCPMNLKDITRSCVQGWKRDGEWPPKGTAQQVKKKGRRMSVAGLFGMKEGEEKEKSPKSPTSMGFKRISQKILSLGGKGEVSGNVNTATPGKVEKVNTVAPS